MFHHTPLRRATFFVLAICGFLYTLNASYFGLEIMAEIVILAILVLALDIAAGHGGMVSLCHGALMGVGAYAYALAATSMDFSPFIALLFAVGLAGLAAWIIGMVCARSHGIYFIMATLAFGQMAYSYAFETPFFGGDDGLSGIPRLDIGTFGVDLSDSRSFVLFLLAVLAAVYMAAAHILRSGLGRSLAGVRHNEQRMLALGLDVRRLKAAVFGISGMIAGLAGALAAQHAMFVSPGLLSWVVSGEALVVAILGGLGTLIGPVVGAVIFVVLKHEVSAFTPYWHLAVGIILIAAVTSGTNGLFGIAEAAAQRLRLRRRARDEETAQQKKAGSALREAEHDA